MDMNFDFETVYPRHDLMIELGQVEMAMDRLTDHHNSDHGALKPSLQSRMQSLMEALDHLAV